MTSFEGSGEEARRTTRKVLKRTSQPPWERPTPVRLSAENESQSGRPATRAEPPSLRRRGAWDPFVARASAETNRAARLEIVAWPGVIESGLGFGPHLRRVNRFCGSGWPHPVRRPITDGRARGSRGGQRRVFRRGGSRGRMVRRRQIPARGRCRAGGRNCNWLRSHPP